MINQKAPKQSLKSQSAWLLTAKVIGFALSFALPLLIVRYLTQENVGRYRESFQVITNAIVLLPLGFSMSAYYYLARETTRRGAAILNILLFNFVVGGIAFFTLYFYPQLIGNIFRSDELTALAPKIGVVIWIWIFSSFLETIAIANREARVATAFIVIANFSKTVLMGTAVLMFATVESFLYAAMVQGVIQTGILAWYLISRFPGFWRKFELGFMREQAAYAIPFGLTGILWMAQYDIHNYFVGYQFSSAEYAIYAYGCFEVPLIAMLVESVTVVLIPRMNELHQAGDREEMIRLTARAMQKLAFAYFPIYVFLMITAETFIITLFTEEYLQSASILVVNLTMLPFSVMISDPIVRAYKELGRFLLGLRVVILAGLIGVLYFGLGFLGLQGIIIAAISAIVLEKCIAETIIIRRLGVGTRHLPLLKNVAKTAVLSVAAGAATYLVYSYTRGDLMQFGESAAAAVFSTTKMSTLNFIGGGLVLAVAAAVFVPIYLAGANAWDVIEESEKEAVGRFLRKLRPGRRADVESAAALIPPVK